MRTQNTNKIIDELIKKIETLDINGDNKKDILKLINNIKTNKNKKEKDPNLPKRPKNSFMCLMEDVHKIRNDKKPGNHFPTNRLDDIKNIIDANKDKPITELTKACGIFWKNAKEEEKNQYEVAYKKSLNKFKKDMEKYEKDQNKLIANV